MATTCPDDSAVGIKRASRSRHEVSRRYQDGRTWRDVSACHLFLQFTLLWYSAPMKTVSPWRDVIESKNPALASVRGITESEAIAKFQEPELLEMTQNAARDHTLSLGTPMHDCMRQTWFFPIRRRQVSGPYNMVLGWNHCIGLVHIENNIYAAEWIFSHSKDGHPVHGGIGITITKAGTIDEWTVYSIEPKPRLQRVTTYTATTCSVSAMFPGRGVERIFFAHIDATPPIPFHAALKWCRRNSKFEPRQMLTIASVCPDATEAEKFNEVHPHKQIIQGGQIKEIEMPLLPNRCKIDTAVLSRGLIRGPGLSPMECNTQAGLIFEPHKTPIYRAFLGNIPGQYSVLVPGDMVPLLEDVIEEMTTIVQDLATNDKIKIPAFFGKSEAITQKANQRLEIMERLNTLEMKALEYLKGLTGGQHGHGSLHETVYEELSVLSTNPDGPYAAFNAHSTIIATVAAYYDALRTLDSDAAEIASNAILAYMRVIEIPLTPDAHAALMNQPASNYVYARPRSNVPQSTSSGGILLRARDVTGIRLFVPHTHVRTKGILPDRNAVVPFQDTPDRVIGTIFIGDDKGTKNAGIPVPSFTFRKELELLGAQMGFSVKKGWNRDLAGEWLRDPQIALSNGVFLMPTTKLDLGKLDRVNVNNPLLRLAGCVEDATSRLLPRDCYVQHSEHVDFNKVPARVMEGEGAEDTERNMTTKKSRTLVEGGNILVALNTEGTRKAIIGESSLIQSMIVLVIQSLLPEKEVNERAKRLAKSFKQTELLDYQARMTLTYAEMRDMTCPNGARLSELMMGKKPTSGEIPLLQVQRYLAKLDLTKDIIAEDLGLPTEDIVIVDQPAFHLDMAMAAGPGGVILLQSYTQSIRVLQDLLRATHGGPEALLQTFGVRNRKSPKQRPLFTRSLSMERLRQVAPEEFPARKPKRLQRSLSSGSIIPVHDQDLLFKPKRIDLSSSEDVTGSNKPSGSQRPEEQLDQQIQEIRQQLERYIDAAFALAPKMQSTEDRICAQLKAAGFVCMPVAGSFAYPAWLGRDGGDGTMVYAANPVNKMVNFFNHLGGSIRMGGGPNPKYKHGQMFYITNAATGPVGWALERHFENNVLKPLGYEHVSFLGREDGAAERSLSFAGALRCLTTVVPHFDLKISNSNTATTPIDIPTAFKTLKSDVAEEKKLIESALSEESSDSLKLVLALSVIEQIETAKTLDEGYRTIRSLPPEADVSTVKDEDKYDYVVSCLHDALADIQLKVPIARPGAVVATLWKKIGDVQLTKFHQDLVTRDLHDYLDDRIIDAFVNIVERRRAGVFCRYEVPVGLLVGTQRWVPTVDLEGIRGLAGNARVEVQVLNQGGNHWVVGVRYPQESNTAVYVYDPLQPLGIAQVTENQLRRCFNLVVDSPITRLAGPRQPFGYECGAYVCAAIEVLTRANLTPAEARGALEFSAPLVARTFDNDAIRNHINDSIDGDDLIGF